MQNSPNRHFLDALKIRDVRFFIGSVACFSLASRALLVVIGFQIYQLTHSAMALGWLGLVEAIPALSLVLFGGYAADHFNRRTILLWTRACSFGCALALAFLSYAAHNPASLFGLYAVIFCAGIARGFADPAGTAFEAQVIPKHLTVSGSSWVSSTWISCWIIGPALIGFIFAAYGAAVCYLIMAALFLGSWLCTWAIPPKTQPQPERKDPVLKSIGDGLHFVFTHQPLWGALALDLFAVLFGGAVALLPIFAEDILHVGARGLGLLNAAPAAGALVMTLWATHRPPIAHAGRNLLWAVTGFGLSILVFAFSRNFWLSWAALFLSGLFDGISVVIRRSMIRLLSPEHLRGRIAAAGWIFICASNELGSFESGMVAAWIGTVPCVIAGGIATLAIVGFTAFFAKELRTLRFDPKTMERKIPS